MATGLRYGEMWARALAMYGAARRRRGGVEDVVTPSQTANMAGLAGPGCRGQPCRCRQHGQQVGLGSLISLAAERGNGVRFAPDIGDAAGLGGIIQVLWYHVCSERDQRRGQHRLVGHGAIPQHLHSSDTPLLPKPGNRDRSRRCRSSCRGSS